MVLGIVVVAILVFGGIWIFAGRGNGDGTAGPATTTSTTSTSTSSPSSTTTTGADTTQATVTTAPPTSTTTEPPPIVRDPADVRVLVLNAKGVAGLAGRVSETLAQAGYEVLAADNYTGESLDISRVWYSEGFSVEALELGAFFPDALVEFKDVSETGADVVVVLAASYEE